MKTSSLKRVPAPPPPPEPKVCVACKAFRAECLVPVGEGSAPMCWLCAHHVVDHERSQDAAATAECECLPHQIYPGREAPAPRLEPSHADLTMAELCGGQRLSAAVRELLEGAVRGMSLAQRATLLKKC